MSTYYGGALFQALETQGWTNETKAMFSWACILVGEREKKQMYGINVQYTTATGKSKAGEGDKGTWALFQMVGQEVLSGGDM